MNTVINIYFNDRLIEQHIYYGDYLDYRNLVASYKYVDDKIIMLSDINSPDIHRAIITHYRNEEYSGNGWRIEIIDPCEITSKLAM